MAHSLLTPARVVVVAVDVALHKYICGIYTTCIQYTLYLYIRIQLVRSAKTRGACDALFWGDKTISELVVLVVQKYV